MDDVWARIQLQPKYLAALVGLIFVCIYTSLLFSAFAATIYPVSPTTSTFVHHLLICIRFVSYFKSCNISIDSAFRNTHYSTLSALFTLNETLPLYRASLGDSFLFNRLEWSTLKIKVSPAQCRVISTGFQCRVFVMQFFRVKAVSHHTALNHISSSTQLFVDRL